MQAVWKSICRICALFSLFTRFGSILTTLTAIHKKKHRSQHRSSNWRFELIIFNLTYTRALSSTTATQHMCPTSANANDVWQLQTSRNERTIDTCKAMLPILESILSLSRTNKSTAACNSTRHILTIPWYDHTPFVVNEHSLRQLNHTQSPKLSSQLQHWFWCETTNSQPHYHAVDNCKLDTWRWISSRRNN